LLGARKTITRVRLASLQSRPRRIRIAHGLRIVRPDFAWLGLIVSVNMELSSAEFDDLEASKLVSGWRQFCITEANSRCLRHSACLYTLKNVVL
jgi:hypothetical protein